ncbi:MAG: glycosyltransferase [Pseudanabaena sp. CAN_BIN31]|nr:glycosyltransferase [Pseudanabaena sp. CAN_BIN31]
MIISTPSKFLLETSPTPIYQRIINAIKNALLELGHTIVTIDHTEIRAINEYFLIIKKESPDFLLLTNPCSVLASYSEELDKFMFENIDIPIIFIHHDNIFSNLYNFKIIQKKLTSFYRIRERCWHFCLEYDNFLDLRSLGINNTFSIPHASEFTKSSPIIKYEYEVSFLGHVLPNLSLTIGGHPFSHLLQSHIWQRIVALDTRLSPYANEFATNQLSGSNKTIDFLSLKYFYISLLHIQSQGFRGEILERIDKGNVSIIGGDTAYIHGSDRNLVINKENIKYYSPKHSDNHVQQIYQNSQINLNITSLQFDDAVINRVIDVAAVGGFVLTDWRSGLEVLTGVHREISYKSIEELNEKIAYYLHPNHQQERLDIAEALHQDIRQKCNYLTIVEGMISQINTSIKDMSDPLRIDLGCGIWKPEGFIGVDISPSPNVDVVANLNRRFPFSDNSAEIIRAHDVIEHLDNRIHTMNELWRISKPDALIDIRVPSTDGRGAFQDPTHVSFWNINSFLYYCVEYPAYLKLCRSYGFKGDFSVVSLTEELSGDNVIHINALLKAVKDTKPEYQMYLDALRDINLVLFPDWQKSEEEIANYLYSYLELILKHPEKKSMTIFVAFNGLDNEEFNSWLVDIILSLIIEKDIDVSDGEPNFITVQINDNRCWENISTYISGVLPVQFSDLTKLSTYFPNIDILTAHNLLDKRWLD